LSVGAQAIEVDSALPNYTPSTGVWGNIKSVGSDTMNNLMTLWSEMFIRMYPSVSVEIEGKGSSTAPPALIAGTSTFGPMSRAMKSKEVDAFQKRFGYKPVQVPSAIDMLAIYVNKDNPIKGLTMAQLDGIFSKTHKTGHPDVKTWGDLGLKGEWARKPISIYGRNSASGTYGYLKKHALKKGDYKDTVKEQPGSAAVIQAVASDKYAIGYSGIGYKTADVLAVPLAGKKGGRFIPAIGQYAYSGEYPLARFLYISVNYRPGSTLEPLRGEFLKCVFSRQGQEIVVKDGFFPITANVARKALSSVGVR
jgi:phosphate transport system substrate-binding protein